MCYLRFLLSQEPSKCDWKQGYLLAMCLKSDFGYRQPGRELEKVIDSQMFSLFVQGVGNGLNEALHRGFRQGTFRRVGNIFDALEATVIFSTPLKRRVGNIFVRSLKQR